MYVHLRYATDIHELRNTDAYSCERVKNISWCNNFVSCFKVGYYKAHPEVPEELSEKAKSFIKRCFEPDPNKRATAAQLLEDPFLGK